MREIRSSGLEGGVEFNAPSLPLFYSMRPPTPFSFVFQRRARKELLTLVHVLRVPMKNKTCYHKRDGL